MEDVLFKNFQSFKVFLEAGSSLFNTQLSTNGNPVFFKYFPDCSSYHLLQLIN